MSEKKQISNFTIRVDTTLKNRFIKVAKENDSDSSKEVRKFIKEYLKRYEKEN